MARLFNFLQIFAEGEFAGGEIGTPAEGSGFESGETATPQTEETFEALTGRGGKYHKEYGAAVKAAVDKRFKNQADNQKIIDQMNPVLQMAAQRYGVAPGENGSINYDALMLAMANDNALYEKEAFDRGMSVEDLKQMKQLEMQNDQLRRRTEQYERQRQADEQWADIMNQAQMVKATYPDFDLDAEMNNPQFGQLLATLQNSGFPDPLMTAFQTIHQSEIMAQGMAYAVNRTAQNVGRSIASGARRPQENGMRSAAPAQFQTVDPSKLSLKDINAMIARAERGEKIQF